MPVIRKYEFDLLDLAAPPPVAAFDILSLVPDEAPAPPAPTFTHADMEAAEQRGFAAGHAAGETEALRGIEARLADMLQQISGALKAADTDQKQALAEMERTAARLTMACLRKLFPVFLAECQTAESEALISQAFSQVKNEPRLILRCTAQDIPVLEPHLQKAASAAGFEGKLTILPDEKLGQGDCRIEWANGGMDRDSDVLLAKIEAVIFRTIDQRAISRHPEIIADDTSALSPAIIEETE